MADENKKTNEKETEKETKDVEKDTKEEMTKGESTKEKTKETSNEKDNKEVEDKKDSDAKEEVKEEPKDELTIAKEKIAELEDKYKRLLAEFDNFRKRNEKEKWENFETGRTDALVKILPIIDNLERALINIPEDIKTNPFVEGVDKTYKQAMKIFTDMEVKPIEALGKPFDAKFHNAVMTDEESKAEPDTVTEELQKGYMYKDQVLRHAMVKVKK